MTTSVEEQRMYIDEDVDVLIAGLLRAHGFNVLTTRDAGRLHATDAMWEGVWRDATPATSRYTTTH